MPPAIGAAAAAIGAGIAGAALPSVAFIFAATLVLGFVSQLLAPKPPKLNNRDQGRRQVVRSSIEPKVVVYGETMAGGLLVLAETTGTDNKYLHLMVAVTGHEVESIGSVFFANDEITTGMLDGNGVVTSGRYANKARIRKHLGAVDQTADTFAVAELPNWTTDHRGRGIGYVYIRLEWDRDVYPTGIPNMRFVVKGRKVWDPRTDPGNPSIVAWSDNPALCQLDYLMSGFGFRASLAEIHESSWVAAANVCDELVSLKAGGNEKRYTANGLFQVDRDKFEVLEDMLTSSVGSVVYQQGAFRGYAGKATTATNVLTEDDLNGDISITNAPSRSGLFNTVQGTYFDKTQMWAATDFPQVSRALYVTEDLGEELIRDMILPFTNVSSMAQRIAALNLDRHRQGIIVSFPAKLRKFDIAPMDVVQVSIDHVGWVNKEFRVIDITFNEEAGVNFTLQEESAAIYDYNPDDEIEVDPAPNTNLPNPWIASPPTNLELLSDASVQTDTTIGDIVSRIKATWDAPADAFIRNYIVEWRNATKGEAYTIAATPKFGDTEIYLSPAIEGDSYDVRVASINEQGVGVTTYEEVTGHVVVSKAPPAINVPNLPDLNNFLESWENLSRLNFWTNHSGSGAPSVVVAADGITGGSYLQVGDGSGDDQALLVFNLNIPVDPLRRYRISARLRRPNGTGTVSIGWAGIAADGVTWVNTSGADSLSSQHFHAAAASAPGISWTEYVGYTQGFGATVGTATPGTLTTPGELHPDIKYIRPLILVNAVNAAGITDIDSLIIDSSLIDQGGLATKDQTATADIEDFAVTNEASGAVSGTISLTTESPAEQWVDIVSASITTLGGEVYILTSAGITAVASAQGSMNIQVRILRDSTEIWGPQTGIVAIGGATVGETRTGVASPAILDTPSVGTYTYKLQARENGFGTGGAGSAANRSLLILERKK